MFISLLNEPVEICSTLPCLLVEWHLSKLTWQMSSEPDRTIKSQLSVLIPISMLYYWFEKLSFVCVHLLISPVDTIVSKDYLNASMVQMRVQRGCLVFSCVPKGVISNTFGGRLGHIAWLRRFISILWELTSAVD